MAIDLTDIAAELAKPRSPENYAGRKYITRTGSRRAHRTNVLIRDAEIHVEYFVDGEWLAATDTDDYCEPTCDVKAVEIGGVDVTRLIDGTALLEEIQTAIEQSWRAGL